MKNTYKVCYANNGVKNHKYVSAKSRTEAHDLFINRFGKKNCVYAIECMIDNREK